MALALRLTRQGHRVTVFERAASVGGLASPAKIGEFTWDRFYHVTLLSDTSLRALLEEIGLADRLRWAVTRTGVFGKGKLHSVSTSLEFLTFPLLSLVDTARLAATILYASRIRDGRALEAIPVTEWLQRWSGRRTWERLWLPLLRSKLGENYRLASASFIWAIIARMYGARRSGQKREMFGYVDGGYDTVLRRLYQHLVDAGVTIRLGAGVEEVHSSAGSAMVRAGDGQTHEFDDVVVTLPCSRIARVCPQLTESERTRLGRVVYQGVLCASVLLRRPLGGFYVTNITDDGFPFTAVIEMTALVDPATFGGHTLVYLPRYLAQEESYWSRNDAEVREDFLQGLERMYPDLRREDVLAFEVSRVREVLAIATLNYSAAAMPPVPTAAEHIYIVNSAQIANGTLNVNETLMLAERQAAILGPLLQPSPALAGAS